jgi:uroporphyrinogen-III synthase
MSTDSDLPLRQLKVLVTRPQAQAQDLCASIEALGGKAITFPTIEIEFIPKAEWAEIDVSHADWLVFVSRNAVAGFVAEQGADFITQQKTAAVGAGTAAAMKQAGLPVTLQPALSNGSEGLLSLSEWQDLSNQHVVIVRGEGGREFLADTLRQRGASIDYIEVYRRTIPACDAAAEQLALSADVLIATSVTGVEHLTEMLKAQHAALIKIPLIVVSERIKQQAQLLGFEQIFVSKEATDEALINQLRQISNEH